MGRALREVGAELGSEKILESKFLRRSSFTPERLGGIQVNARASPTTSTWPEKAQCSYVPTEEKQV